MQQCGRATVNRTARCAQIGHPPAPAPRPAEPRPWRWAQLHLPGLLRQGCKVGGKLRVGKDHGLVPSRHRPAVHRSSGWRRPPRHTTSAPSAAALVIFFSLSPGTYRSARRGRRPSTDLRRAAARRRSAFCGSLPACGSLQLHAEMPPTLLVGPAQLQSPRKGQSAPSGSGQRGQAAQLLLQAQMHAVASAVVTNRDRGGHRSRGARRGVRAAASRRSNPRTTTGAAGAGLFALATRRGTLRVRVAAAIDRHAPTHTHRVLVVARCHPIPLPSPSLSCCCGLLASHLAACATFWRARSRAASCQQLPHAPPPPAREHVLAPAGRPLQHHGAAAASRHAGAL